MKRKGVFLTLGITFVSVVILALATLILRNAESSEERIVELATFDRIYNADRSLGALFKDVFFNVTNFNLTINESYLKLDKFLTNVTFTTDLDMAVIDDLFGLYYATTLYPTFSFDVYSLTSDFVRYIFNDFKTMLIYYQLKDASQTNPFSPFATGLSKFLVFTTNPKLVRNYTIIIKHNQLNGTVNWTKYTPETCTTGPGSYEDIYGCGHTLNVTVLGPGGWINYSSKMVHVGLPSAGDLSQIVEVLSYNSTKLPLVGLSALTTGIFSSPGTVSFGVVNYHHNLTVTFILEYYPDKKIILEMLGERTRYNIPALGIRKHSNIRVL